MLRNHLFLCLFGISACFLVDTNACEAIIGGTRANVNQFPYVVSVQCTGTRNKGHICGGSIINDRYILTAAHCVISHLGRFRQNPLSIVAGTNDMSQTTEPAIVVAVGKIYASIEYSPPRVNSGNVAVLKLVGFLELSKNKHLQSLKLPRTKFEGEHANDGKMAEIAGWGWHWIQINDKKETGGRNDTILRYAEADVIRTSQCQAEYPSRNITKRELCARVKQPNDHSKVRSACEGDGGAPLVHNEYVIGVLSAVPQNCSENKVASIYTRVSHYLTFIDNAMKDRKTNIVREFIL